MDKEDLKKRLWDLKKDVGSAQVIAVSKYSPVADIYKAYEIGQHDFGENRVADLEEKAQFFSQKSIVDIRWHFIGNLQTNKVRDLLRIPNLWAIHSVSSKKIIEELIKKEHEFKGEKLKLFFQVNTSHEEEKSGFLDFDELKEAVEFFISYKSQRLQLYGLMTMGSIRALDQQAAAFESFTKLRSARDEIQKELGLNYLKLSMGMSADYQLAVKEGADYIRVGSAIFK